MILTDLNDDELTLIFDKCLLDDVLRLFHVCRRFQVIIERHTLFKRSLDLLLVGHRNRNAESYQKTINDLSYNKRVKIFRNWCNGRYEEHILFHHRQFNPSKIFLEKDHLYKTHSGQLRVYRRLKGRRHGNCGGGGGGGGGSSAVLSHWPSQTYGNVRDADITCFTKKDSTIFLGRRNGRVTTISTADENDALLETIAGEAGSITSRLESVDFANDLFATTTLYKTALWRKKYELDIPFLEPLVSLDSGHKCIRLSPEIDQMAVGEYKDRSRRALGLMDLETNTVVTLNSDTTSVYDILWKDNQTILTGHYDTTFRLFDRRTNSDQLIWHDPYDLAVYCMSYDGNYGVLCGMKYHCRVNLYDLRVPKRYIQLYFPRMRFRGATGHSSPAYSVANDQSQLFIATDHNLRVLDFDADWAAAKDYTNMFVHEMIVHVTT